MIEIFNRLQQIFGRPITLVYIDDCILEVQLSWWSSEVFTITPDLQVYDCVGSCDATTVGYKVYFKEPSETTLANWCRNAKAD